MKNPFKFGSIVDGEHFTDRTSESALVESVVNSLNHLVIISPRRYGKTSLVHRVLRQSSRPAITLDLQWVTDPSDFAAQLLKRVYRLYPIEKIKGYIQHFRVIPQVSLNPVTNSVDVSFHAGSSENPALEDVLTLLENISHPDRKMIVVLDEFQEVLKFDHRLIAKMRSVMQHHKNINYVMLGSQESMMRDIFEKKRSPFYHFGVLMYLDAIPESEFLAFLSDKLSMIGSRSEAIAGEILAVTGCHPYYTQQLAYFTWERLRSGSDPETCVESALQQVVQMHDMDYERLWIGLNKTDQKVLIGIAEGADTPLSANFLYRYGISATSTVYSSMKRLVDKGYLINLSKGYLIDDPFFKMWLLQSRESSK